jgi:hypothetical protein
LPEAQSDYLANTVLDGLIALSPVMLGLDFKVTREYPSPFDLSLHTLSENEFVEYARKADIVLLVWGKKATRFKLAEEIGMWNKTIFIDGSEFGKDNRYNFDIQKKILLGTYDGGGAINQEILEKCVLYLRREKPYVTGIIPFPFGIESRYISKLLGTVEKDIDFVCIFGQDEYPVMRRYAREMLENFCKENNFTCATNRTYGFNFDDKTKQAGRDEFFNLLARAKVGVSIGGGGFDTARFWEILGNNCMLLTEKIEIYEPYSTQIFLIFKLLSRSLANR